MYCVCACTRVHVCVPDAFPLYIPKFTHLGSSFSKACHSHFMQKPGLFPKCPQSPTCLPQVYTLLVTSCL